MKTSRYSDDDSDDSDSDDDDDESDRHSKMMLLTTMTMMTTIAPNIHGKTKPLSCTGTYFRIDIA